MSLSRDVTLGSLDERHTHQLPLHLTWIDVGNALLERIHTLLHEQGLHLFRIEETVLAVVGYVDDDLSAQRCLLGGFVPRGDGHEEVTGYYQIECHNQRSFPVNV
jgi:hypothetical protein